MTVPPPEPGPVWYGESFRLDGGRDISGGTFDVTKWFYHFDGKSALLEPGADVIVGAYADSFDPDLFAAYDQPITLRWVIEVDGGGSVDLWAGTDPSWNYDDPDLATQYLGTLTSTGPGTLVSEPFEVIDHAGLVAQDVPVIARLKSSDGLRIVQVKLRVWPSSGAGGAWRLAGEWYRTDANVERWSGAVNEGTPQRPTYEVAWDQMHDLMKEWGKRTVQYGRTTIGKVSVTAFFQVLHDGLVAPFQFTAGAGADTALVLARPGGAAIEPGIDYGYDPNEVWREEQARLRAPGGGPAQAFFDRWTDEATITPADPGGTLIAGAGLPGDPNLTVDPDNPAFRLGQFVFPTNWLRQVGPVPFSQINATSQFLAFSVMGAAYYPPAPESDVTTTAVAEIGETLPFRTRIANYEWFDPTATPTPEPSRKPRFYVTYTEVESDPREVSHIVGIGKPADDASLFQVTTPLGTLRELRHGEKVADVSVCYPLKVKLEDGSWTVVAGTTPDD